MGTRAEPFVDGQQTETSNKHSANRKWLHLVYSLSTHTSPSKDMDNDNTVRGTTFPNCADKQFLRRHHHLLATHITCVVVQAQIPCGAPEPSCVDAGRSKSTACTISSGSSSLHLPLPRTGASHLTSPCSIMAAGVGKRGNSDARHARLQLAMHCPALRR